jgi:hypothetical protein
MITVTDTATNESFVVEGDWVHTPRKGSPLATLADPEFHVDRGTFTLRMILPLIDKGLTHAYGSEASAVKSTYENKMKKDTGNPKFKMPDEDAAAMIRDAQIRIRDDMESDRWGSGQKTRTGPAVSKQDQMFATRVAAFVRTMLNAGEFERQGGMWINPGDGNPYPLQDYVTGFLTNAAPSEGVDEVEGFSGPGITLGAARRAKFMAAVVAEMNTATAKVVPTI